MARAPEASFLGRHINKVDAKGRIAAPADFRKALDLARFNGFFAIPSLEGAHLDCGGGDYIAKLKASIYALDPFDPDRRALEVAILGEARPISLDGEGRFVLPEPLREHAKLVDRACFIGLGDTFQLWPAATADAAVADQREIARKALARLRNPFAPVSVHESGVSS